MAGKMDKRDSSPFVGYCSCSDGGVRPHLQEIPLHADLHMESFLRLEEKKKQGHLIAWEEKMDKERSQSI